MLNYTLDLKDVLLDWLLYMVTVKLSLRFPEEGSHSAGRNVDEVWIAEL